ncbi:hypothetical protein [Psychromonas sp. Urea-02u-13]|uniref:hypothetical protein n=1 Tax=Psychromonas sp. Urea-02u-13 TaxID=2058326 RepID=UPI000C33FCAB|nr:hypothetical protein [Psychromonas sp. Urea-02u-13]PKG38406.1 hypothetical protein CXF74_14020 [Psychromonas sp. Urea-02u-13]
MEAFTSFTLARALHIFAIVLWIGGVAFVTTVLIPSLKQIPDIHDRLALFEKLEGKFAIQARITTVITLLTGLYMIDFMQIWGRFLQAEFWWMHLMVIVWLLFTLVLFVFEPLFLHAWFRKQALIDSKKTFKRVHMMHIILLTVSLITILGAMLGAHGFRF